MNTWKFGDITSIISGLAACVHTKLVEAEPSQLYANMFLITPQKWWMFWMRNVMFLCSWILMLCYRLFYVSLFLIPFFDWFCWFPRWGLYIVLMMSAVLVTYWCLIMFCYILVSNHALESVGSSVLKSLIICLVFGSCSFRSFGLLLHLFSFKQTYFM